MRVRDSETRVCGCLASGGQRIVEEACTVAGLWVRWSRSEMLRQIGLQLCRQVRSNTMHQFMTTVLCHCLHVGEAPAGTHRADVLSLVQSCVFSLRLVDRHRSLHCPCTARDAA